MENIKIFIWNHLKCWAHSWFRFWRSFRHDWISCRAEASKSGCPVVELVRDLDPPFDEPAELYWSMSAWTAINISPFLIPAAARVFVRNFDGISCCISRGTYDFNRSILKNFQSWSSSRNNWLFLLKTISFGSRLFSVQNNIFRVPISLPPVHQTLTYHKE